MSTDNILEKQDCRNTSLNTRIDWQALRERSLLPGGFGEERVKLWAKLLHAPPTPLHSSGELPISGHDRGASTDETSAQHEKSGPDVTAEEPHPDERQIGLDTNRSFVLYPVADPGADREKLQARLHHLLVKFFRKRRKLHYFQGYHDIVTVLFLTLPDELQLSCVEQLSLHRVRDSMGLTLEPVLGLLRILMNLLRLVDAPYASILESTSPLPFFALSNLLTLFSHDMPTLPLIQHVFDYLLCRPPITVVYLAAAVILTRKAEVERLVDEDEEGLIHSLLSGLPSFSDDNRLEKPEQVVSADDAAFYQKIGGEAVDGVTVSNAGTSSIPRALLEIDDAVSESDGETLVSHSREVYPSAGTQHEGADADADAPDPDNEDGARTEVALSELGAGDARTKEMELGASLKPTEIGSEMEAKDEEQPPTDVSPDLSTPEVLKLSPDSGPSRDNDANGDADDTDPDSDDLSHPPPHRPSPIPLTYLLARASELYALYPPSHPALSVSAILGPKSAMHTWREDASFLPPDDDAEEMVRHPEEIVYPFPEPSKAEDSDLDSSLEDYHSPESRRLPGRPVGRKQRIDGRRIFASRVVARRTVLAGAVLVLGIAIAYYGARSGAVVRAHHGGPMGLGAMAWWGGLMEYINQR